MTLPIYYTYQKKKGTKPVTILIGLNEVYKMHYIHKNKMVKHYYSMIAKKLAKIKIIGNIKTKYTLYYKNSQSDAPNVVAVIDKVFVDALQLNGVIKDDNVLNYIGSSWEIGGQDKENPRLEVEIFEVS